MIYRRWVKRFFDIVFGMAALIVLSPLIFIAAAAIRLSSPGPIVFRQRRVGYQGKVFEILKLRTMVVRQDREVEQTYNNSADVFPVGRVLRRLKLDEAPQLTNVLKGDMSLVGPRPCMEQTAREMPDWAKARFDVLPGLTGAAQINGNTALSWEERWRYDVEYARLCSFRLDMAILAKTIAVVLGGEERFRRLP